MVNKTLEKITEYRKAVLVYTNLVLLLIYYENAF